MRTIFLSACVFLLIWGMSFDANADLSSSVSKFTQSLVRLNSVVDLYPGESIGFDADKSLFSIRQTKSEMGELLGALRLILVLAIVVPVLTCGISIVANIVTLATAASQGIRFGWGVFGVVSGLLTGIPGISAVSSRLNEFPGWVWLGLALPTFGLGFANIVIP